MIAYSDSFEQTILGVFGDAGAAWLAGLPTLAADLEARWSVRLGKPFSLSYNYVAPAVGADGTEYVVKLGVPDPNPELRTEIEALRMCAGCGMVRLVASDLELGVLLLERLKPGRMLVELDDDDRRTRIAAQVMQRIWRPLPEGHPFPDLIRRTRSLRTYAAEPGRRGPLPAGLVDRAVRMAADLLKSPGPTLLLHGDFHHFNVLSRVETPRDTAEDWCAIDPKGVAGEPEFEVGALMGNPFTEPPAPDELGRIEARRLDLLAEQLGFDRQKLLHWAAVYAVLSIVWSVEDHTPWDTGLAVAETLMEMVG